MKVQVNNEHLFEISEIQKKVICNDILSDEFDSDMKRRLQYILMHKYERCFERLKKEWEPKLALRLESVPTNPDKFAQLVFSQPDYKCRKMREDELKSKK